MKRDNGVRMRGRCGFTLIEVLISMALFALVSAMTFQGLHVSMTVQEASEERARDFGDLHLVWTLMLHDFVHLVRRPVRNQYGMRVYRAFMLQGDGCSVSFTRYTPFSRSGLQRVAYCYIGDALYRRVWSVIDRGNVSKYREALLISDVESFSLDAEGLTRVRDNSPAHVYEQLPTHIEVSLRVRDEDYVRYFPGLSSYDPFGGQNVPARDEPETDERERGRTERARGGREVEPDADGQGA